MKALARSKRSADFSPLRPQSFSRMSSEILQIEFSFFKNFAFSRFPQALLSIFMFDVDEHLSESCDTKYSQKMKNISKIPGNLPILAQHFQKFPKFPKFKLFIFKNEQFIRLFRLRCAASATAPSRSGPCASARSRRCSRRRLGAAPARRRRRRPWRSRRGSWPRPTRQGSR